MRRAHARAAELERLNETERQLSEKTEQSGMHKTVLALFAVGVVVCAALYYAIFHCLTSRTATGQYCTFRAPRMPRRASYDVPNDRRPKDV